MQSSLERAFRFFINIIGYVFLTIFILYFVNLAGKELDRDGYIPHNKLAYVWSDGWTQGEYKDCFTANMPNNSQPYLVCGEEANKPGKEFRVRFYGLLYRDTAVSTENNLWKCRKNDDADPAITCEMAKKD